MTQVFAEVRRTVGWLRTFGAVFPWERAWWAEVGNRIARRVTGR